MKISVKRGSHFLVAFLAIVFSQNFTVNAQQATLNDFKECGEQLDEATFETYRQTVARERLNNNTSLVALPPVIEKPVQFHSLRNSNGTDGLTQEQVDSALLLANIKFAPVGIHFYQCQPVHYINDDAQNAVQYIFEWPNNCDSITPETILANANNVANVINIYLLTTNGWNWASLPQSKDASCFDWIVLRKTSYNSEWILAHELGHYFNLLHTHQTRTQSGFTIKETITRDSTTICYNCDVEGDLICDTPADPYLKDSIVFNQNNCTYIGNYSDGCSSSNYVTDPLNLMCYANGCQQYFSQGQIDRMRFAADSLRDYLACSTLSICKSKWNLTSNQVYNYSYQATDFIKSTSTIIPTVTSVYDAQNYIQLKVGFNAVAGCTFTALLDGCFGPRTFKYALPFGNNLADEKNSQLKKLSDENDSIHLEIYPNPIKNNAIIYFQLPVADNITIYITDIYGRGSFSILKNELRLQGENKVSFDGSQLNNGIYQLVIQSNTWAKSARLVVVH